MKIRPVEGELLHAPGQTDMPKQTVAFRNFAKAPKKTDTYVNYQLNWKLTETYFLICDSSLTSIRARTIIGFYTA